MNNNNDILLDALFDKARNESPKTSFATTKERFLADIKGGKIPKMNGRGGAQFFNLKNWIIMGLSATAIAITSVMLLNSTTTNNEYTETIGQAVNMVMNDSEYAIQEHEEHIRQYLEKVKKIAPEMKAQQEIDLHLALKGMEPLLVGLDTLKKGADLMDQRKMEEDTTYSFPHLTPEEVKANNKHKAKMLKELARLDKDRYVLIPSGKYIATDKKEVMVNSFYIQTTEVTNLEYRTFLFDLLIHGRKEEFLRAKPDQAAWMSLGGKWLKPMQDNYFSHPAYDHYPVVNISREGAEMYCRWLTDERNNMDKKRYTKTINDVRLPDNMEWEYAAMGPEKNYPYPWGGPYLRNAKGCFLANYKPGKDTCETCSEEWSKLKDVKESDSLYGYVQTMDDVKIPKTLKNPYSADGGYYTVMVSSYNPNGYGLFCMSGNVAEMVYYHKETNVPGTRGGSWGSPAIEIQINGPDSFKGKTEASPFIGFRPVITFLRK